jgi:hypothetical protein
MIRLLQEVFKYAPYILILLSKFAYDHREGLFTFLLLLVCFSHANNAVREELAKLGNRSLKKLFSELLYTICCLVLMNLMFENTEHLLKSVIMMPSYTEPLTGWDLIWLVCVTDFLIKLITIDVKIFITCLPIKFIPIAKRVSVSFFKFKLLFVRSLNY